MEKQIEALEKEIKFANEKYRAGNPVMSDSAYDSLLDELKAISPDNTLLEKAVIENVPSNPRKEKLPYPMYSMDKLHTIREIYEWLDSKKVSHKVDLILTPKFDGISLVVKDKASECWTRGNGEIGQRSDKHYKAMKPNSKNIDNIVFGEAIIIQRKWRTYFEGQKSEKTGELYKISRNTVAGLFNRDETASELELVNYVRYGINRPDLPKSSQLDYLNKYCNKASEQVPYIKIKACDLTEKILDDFYQKMVKIFPIDGIILEIDDPYGRNELGREENNNPAYARAIKLPYWADSADVEIKSHKMSISKQGLLKGTVQFNPVNIKGAEIRQATFINASFLTDFGLVVGSKIKVCTSGDIIPKIIEVEDIKIPFREYFETQKEYDEAYEAATIAFQLKFPDRIDQISDETTYCPCCGEPLKWNETMKEKVCSNRQCKDIRIAKLVHFFKTIGMENFGEPTIKKIYDLGFRNAIDIVNNTNEVSGIEGYGVKSFVKFFTQINKFKEEGVPLAKQLYALDIFEGVIGEKLCQKIFDERGSIWTPLSILSIEGVSKKTSAVFCNAIEHLQDVNAIPFRVSYVCTPKVEVKEGGKYIGWKACFSGVRLKGDDLENFKKEGGEVVSGVSSKTTHLIVKDVTAISSKIIKAKKLNIKILSINKLS